jgi:hypothetical protein
LSDYEPIEWGKLHNVQDGIDFMLKKFELAIKDLMKFNALHLPTKNYTITTDICSWSGCDDYVSEIAEKFGRGVATSKYEVNIDFIVDCPKEIMPKCYEFEDKMEYLIDKSTYIKELAKNYECPVFVCVIHKDGISRFDADE